MLNATQMGGSCRGDGFGGGRRPCLPVKPFTGSALECLPGSVGSRLPWPNRCAIPRTTKAVCQSVAAPLRALQIPSAKYAAHRHRVNKVSVSRTSCVRASFGHHLRTASSAPSFFKWCLHLAPTVALFPARSTRIFNSR